MPTITAPYVETQQVVTGFMYQLHIAAEENAPITRLDIGPYKFAGTPPQVKYPEAVTNEMCPPGWEAVHWVTDASGASWLRWEGGSLDASDGEVIFQMTSNYPPATSGGSLFVSRGAGRQTDKYNIPAPDYSVAPPHINQRHDVIGQRAFTKGLGCAPAIALALLPVLIFAFRHLIG